MRESGKQAEAFAAQYLERRGFTILERNWSNRFGEVDIIAKKEDTVHFIEVKYRKSASFGSAHEYLTKKKLRQVRFTAKLWMQENEWDGASQIDGVAITGSLQEANTRFFSNIQ